MTLSKTLLAFRLLCVLATPGALAQDGSVEVGVDFGFNGRLR